MVMARIIAFAACGFALACCSGPSWSPSYSLAPNFEALAFKPPTVKLALESNPPGAEARSPQGLTCRTPCTLELPIMNEPFSISYALSGYAPQSVAVRPVMPVNTVSGVPFYQPDPAFVQLSPAEPPKPVKPTPPKKKRPDASAAAPAPASTAQVPPPSGQRPFPPGPVIPYPPPGASQFPPR